MSGAMQLRLMGSSAAPSAYVTIAPSSINGAPANGASYSTTATATPTGITTPTYAWSWASGGTGLTLTNATTATVTISSPGHATGTDLFGTLQCTVSGTGGPATSSISVDVTWGA